MKVLRRVTLLLLAMTASSVVLFAQVPSAGAPAVRSPEVLPDGRVTFRLLAPEATEVRLNGQWPDGRNVVMTNDDSGVWSVTVGPLKPELWMYSYTVDGARAIDPDERPRRRRAPAGRSARERDSGRPEFTL